MWCSSPEGAGGIFSWRRVAGAVGGRGGRELLLLLLLLLLAPLQDLGVDRRGALLQRRRQAGRAHLPSIRGGAAPRHHPSAHTRWLDGRVARRTKRPPPRCSCPRTQRLSQGSASRPLDRVRAAIQTATLHVVVCVREKTVVVCGTRLFCFKVGWRWK